MNETKTLLAAISLAYYNLDYYQFLEKTGFVDSLYAMEKFQLFQQSIKGLLQFDSETLQVLLN